MHSSRGTINRQLQLYSAENVRKQPSLVSEWIQKQPNKIHHRVDLTFLEPASDILYRTDKKGLAENSRIIKNRLHFTWEETPFYHTSPALTTTRESGSSGTCSYSIIWRILNRHQARAHMEGMEEPSGYGFDADVPKGGAHHTVGCTFQCQGGQHLPGSLCALVPLYRAGSP